RVQGAEWLLLGAAELADGTAEPGPGAVALFAEDVVAASLALDRAARATRGALGLDLRQPFPGALRALHLPRRRHPRLQHDPLWRADRRLRAAALPRHLQLGVRAGLAAGELIRLARAA